jgi:hypothetical protein
MLNADNKDVTVNEKYSITTTVCIHCYKPYNSQTKIGLVTLSNEQTIWWHLVGYCRKEIT